VIIIGHNLIPYKNLYKISTIKQIEKTPSNSTVLFDFNEEILTYVKDSLISFAVCVENSTQACLANALGARYIIVYKEDIKEIQKVANEYLFDAKILYKIRKEEEMEFAIDCFVDGVLFENAIKEKI
jgi:hypothetical protein